MPEEFDGPDDSDNLNNPPSFFPYNEDAPDSGRFVEVEVQGVFSGESDDHTRELLVLLTHGDDRLTIRIDAYGARAISLPLEAAQPDRPQTHDLIKTLFDKLGAELVRIVIDDLFNDVYYAKLHIKAGKQELEIDSRPSDAIALAVRMEAPIFVSEELLEQDA